MAARLFVGSVTLSEVYQELNLAGLDEIFPIGSPTIGRRAGYTTCKRSKGGTVFYAQAVLY
jgi:hypothetical protein